MKVRMSTKTKIIEFDRGAAARRERRRRVDHEWAIAVSDESAKDGLIFFVQLLLCLHPRVMTMFNLDIVDIGYLR